jgi:hypothetical protein
VNRQAHERATENKAAVCVYCAPLQARHQLPLGSPKLADRMCVDVCEHVHTSLCEFV